MDLIARRFRGVLIAIVVLGLSAGAVFAGHVVLQAPATTPTASEQGDQDEQADNEAPEAPEAAETPEAPDADETDGTGAPGDNHGALVSRAAQMETPVAAVGTVGFANHGEFVSCVAHMTLPEGSDPATFDFSTVTPESCATDAAARAAEKAAAKADRLHGKAGTHGKGHNR